MSASTASSAGRFAWMSLKIPSRMLSTPAPRLVSLTVVRHDDTFGHGRKGRYQPVKECRLPEQETGHIDGPNPGKRVRQAPSKRHGRVGERCRCCEPERQGEVNDADVNRCMKGPQIGIGIARSVAKTGCCGPSACGCGRSGQTVRDREMRDRRTEFIGRRAMKRVRPVPDVGMHCASGVACGQQSGPNHRGGASATHCRA